MGMRNEYWCDICGDKFDRKAAYNDLIGLRFTGNYTFVFGDAFATDGKHICHRCCKQLKMWLNERESI